MQNTEVECQTTSVYFYLHVAAEGDNEFTTLSKTEQNWFYDIIWFVETTNFIEVGNI